SVRTAGSARSAGSPSFARAEFMRATTDDSYDAGRAPSFTAACADGAATSGTARAVASATTRDRRRKVERIPTASAGTRADFNLAARDVGYSGPLLGQAG